MDEFEIKLFENQEIRRKWDAELEDYYYSIVDVISVLSKSNNPRRYWSDLKRKMKEQEGSQLYENIVQLKLKSSDGKFYKTDVANTKQLLRIIQSIPSPNAEPFKIWLAEVGKERIDEIKDPERAIERAIESYRRQGYSEEWISQRMRSIEVRKDLTGEWKNRGVKFGEYGILTNEVSKAWSGKTVSEYKKFKNLKGESLRDNMTNAELVFNMLAEVSTTELSRGTKPKNFEENKIVAREGGGIAGDARRKLERKSGRKIVSSRNAKCDKNVLDI